MAVVPKMEDMELVQGSECTGDPVTLCELCTLLA